MSDFDNEMHRLELAWQHLSALDKPAFWRAAAEGPDEVGEQVRSEAEPVK